MKIIHCADIHIGSIMQNLPSDRAKIRKREVLDSFFAMIDFAICDKVDVIIIAGDLFDSKKIAHSTKREIFDAIAAAHSVTFLYLSGNHDSYFSKEASQLDPPPNFKLFTEQDDWSYYEFGSVTIAGIDIGSQSGTTFYEKLRLNKSHFNIAVMHASPKDLQLERLKGRHIDYLALGDIHIPDMLPKKLDNRGVYAYSGCLEGRGFDEVGQRGFFKLEINNSKVERTFHTVSKRQYETIFVDITGLDNHTKINNAINEAVNKINKDNIVKVILTGKRTAATQIEKENLERKLIDRFFYGKIKDESTLDMGSVSFDNEISLRSEFVKLVVNSHLSATEKEKIIEYGIKALNGEVIDL